jgi:hypothetical protein
MSPEQTLTGLSIPCPVCNKPMRLSGVRPHDRFRNLDNRHFECRCGYSDSYTIARPEEGTESAVS